MLFAHPLMWRRERNYLALAAAHKKIKNPDDDKRPSLPCCWMDAAVRFSSPFFHIVCVSLISLSQHESVGLAHQKSCCVMHSQGFDLAAPAKEEVWSFWALCRFAWAGSLCYHGASHTCTGCIKRKVQQDEKRRKKLRAAPNTHTNERDLGKYKGKCTRRMMKRARGTICIL